MTIIRPLTAQAATSTNSRHSDNYKHKADNIGFSSNNATRSGQPGTSPGAHSGNGTEHIRRIREALAASFSGEK